MPRLDLNLHTLLGRQLFIKTVLVALHRGNFILNKNQNILEVDVWESTSLTSGGKIHYYFGIKGDLGSVFLRPWVRKWLFRWFRLPFNAESLLRWMFFVRDERMPAEFSELLTVNGFKISYKREIILK